MDLYCIVAYMLFCVALVLSFFSFTSNVFKVSVFKKGVICVIVAILSVIHFGNYSFANLLYSIFDLPSFLLTLVCLVSIIRNFFYKIEVYISIQGMVFLFIVWGLFCLNTIGVFEWYYGSINYKILIICICVAFAYCIDRICGVFMLICFMFWIIFGQYIDIYHAMFDPLICTLCYIIQGSPSYKDRLHVALLKPKVK